MAKVTFGLALSITVADRVDVSHIKTVWDVAAYAGTQIVVDYHFQNCRNAVEHSENGGHILDFDIGLSQASLFDVNAGSQSTLLSTIFDIFFSLFLFHLAALIISLPRF